MPYDYTLSPTYGIFPNVLEFVDPTFFLIILIGASLHMAFNMFPRISAAILFYGWACLLNRNVFISNPGMPYVGFILLSSTLIERQYDQVHKRLIWVAWFLLGIGYTASGIHKLQCPSWIDGTAVLHVLNSPLARNNFIRNFIVALPIDCLKLMTWGSLFLEISYLPLGVFYHTRFFYWIASMMFHLGILLTINFTDLTIGMIMIHLFVYEDRYTRYFYTVINLFIKKTDGVCVAYADRKTTKTRKID
jgi:hypothetical protein